MMIKRFQHIAIGLMVVASLLPASLKAQQAPLITNIAARQTTSLDGQWRSIVDPFENGYYDYRLRPYPGYGLDKTYSDKRTLQEHDFETSAHLSVPGDWNTQRDELYYYEGTVWYRKRFDYDLDSSRRLFVHFGAVNYESIVWVNGKQLGTHIGGFTPFNYEITDLVHSGENSIVVKVDNKRKAEGVPTVNTDWWNYGGITRPVTLVETPSTFIQDYYIQLDKNDPRTIEGWVQLDGSSIGGHEVMVEIPELKLKLKAQADDSGRASFSVKAKPELWSPTSPKLYKVVVSSPLDSLEDEIGFRTITTQGTKIMLNGQEIFCRGISVHEETAYDSTRAYSRDHAETLLGWAKEMNCNFVRLAHYPHNEEMVRAAERMGFLVWSEIPVYWTIHWDNPETYLNAKSQLTDMITRDKNRCNIIIWSIANETPHSDSRLSFLTSLANEARSMDDVRLIGAAMELENLGNDTVTVNDPLGEVLDIVSFNQYVGWYDGTSEKCDRMSWVFDSGKPVFVSEFGGGALYGRHGDKDEFFTEEYQYDLYQRQVAMLQRIEGLAGTTPWILKDFRSPRRQVPGIQDGFNRKGLISDKGQKKQAFFVMQEWYKALMGLE